MKLTRSGWIVVEHPSTGAQHSRHVQEREAVESAANLARELDVDVTIRYEQTVLVEREATDDGGGGLVEEPPLEVVDPVAGDYFVATDGSDANDGSVGAPFATIGKAAAVVQPGDVVLIRGGTHTERVKLTTSGTKDQPITFAGYPGEHVTLDGYPGTYEPDETGRDMRHGWEVAASWNVIRDLDVTNANYMGLYLAGSDNIARRVNAHSNRYHGILLGGSRNTLEDCVGHDNQQPNGGWRADRGEFQQSADGIAFSGAGHTARRCVTYRNADDGIDAWGSEDVTLDACVSHGNGFDHGNGNGFKLPPKAASAATTHHCVAFNNLRRGFTNNGGSPHAFTNNTSFNNAQIGFQNVDAPSNEYTNNVASGHGSDDFQVYSGDEPTQAFNTWNLDITDPRFQSTDPTNPAFLQLAADSPCIGAGADGADLGALAAAQTIADLLGRPLDGVNA